MTYPASSLAEYRAYAVQATPTVPDFTTPRPKGEIVWIHLGDAAEQLSFLDLADRLIGLRPGLSVLLSVPHPAKIDGTAREISDRITTVEAPPDHPAAVSGFLEHWQPDVVLWVWGDLKPLLLEAALEQIGAVHLVSADQAGLGLREFAWVPEVLRSFLPRFASVSARNAVSSQMLARFTTGGANIPIVPEMPVTGRLLSYQPTDLDELLEHLKARPVWLAANAHPDEWARILVAHRIAMRSAHRLLLVLNPVDGADLEPLLQEMSAQYLSNAVWGNGEWPEETTQVLVADLPDELGLWFRIAAVSFLGSSLDPGKTGTDPMAAAALGTAILYGPNVTQHIEGYSRLVKVGAARVVNDDISLGNAVGQLIMPDQAAAMAHAGWNVISKGAEIVDGIIDLVQESLDDQIRA